MKYYLNCDTKTEFNEVLSMLNYYGFAVNLGEQFDLTNINLFVVDTDKLEAKFTHNVKLEKELETKGLTLLKDFEDAYLKELSLAL